MVKLNMRKRQAVGLVIVVLIVFILIGGYWVYRSTTQRPAPVVDTATQQEVEKLNVKGDQTIAGQYASALKKDDAAAAQAVFDNAVKMAQDKQEKLNLLSQNVSLALAYKQSNHAVKAALAAIDLSPTFTSYNDAFRVYAVTGDYVKQKEMLQKAIDALRASDDPRKEQLLPVLNQQMSAVDQQASRAGVN